MRNLSAFRIAYWFVMISVPIVYFINYLRLSRPANVKVAETAAQLHQLNKESFIDMMIAAGIFLILAHLLMKLLEKIIGTKLYWKFTKSGATHLLVGVDKEKGDFVLGEDQKRVPITDAFIVVSTPNNYLFYKGRSLNPLMFFLPKRGSDSHDEVVKEMIEAVRRENVTMKERKK
ncbi:hypothetical protein LCM10_05005 [Rossellomorea aquimaris]|uniref:hypothetical protein n=1 Tax=Rossellomorea aquimaris TaxID=189382 RepID=UPI001CD32BCD|nr:hypothetical protein [Rossellomorea aquimaris]MCA1054338.1 hypothetical protein [Rossellomorea aquimaris]